MLTKQIPISLETNSLGYEFIAELYLSISSQDIKDISIDFSSCSCIDGNLAAALGAIFDRLESEGFHIMLSFPRDKQVRRILSRNHFLRAWNVQTNTEDRESYVEYKKFESKDSDTFKKYIDDNLLHKQNFPRHTTRVAEHIIENIYEIYVNAITHGETEYVYSCGEYKDNTRTLEMTIVDCGQTIPENVNNFFKVKQMETKDACSTIEWAFVEGNTTKSNPGGLGLAILQHFIELNNGAIQVVSGQGMIEIKGKKVEQFLLDLEFPGTIVNMKFNFDDNNKYSMTSEIDKNNLL